MTTSEKLSDDLAYVRAAIDRQRKMLCDALPLWAALSIGAYLILVAVLGDLKSFGHVSDSLLDIVTLSGAALLMAMLFLQDRRLRARRRETGATASTLDRAQRRKFVLQTATFMAAIVIFNLIGDQSGIPSDIAKTYQLLLMATCLILIGLNGLNMILWLGLGLALGGVGDFYLDIEWPRTLLASSGALGIMTGAALDRRALARKA